MVNIALFGWPIVSVLFFRLLDIRAAIAVTVIGGYLLLPPIDGINLPVLPTIDKEAVAAISALFLALLFAGKATGAAQSLPGWLPRSPTVLLLIALLVVGAFMTVQTNGDRLTIGERSLPPLRLYDAFSVTQGILVALLPFFLGRKFFATGDSHRVLLITLCLAGLAYSLPALYEVRMSPQLNRDIYGFFPHDWAQHIRSGGFRPVVFLEHGLQLGIFLCCTVLAAATCFRARLVQAPGRFLLATLWLLVTLFLAKTLGAFLIALVLLPAILFLNTRAQLLVAGAFGAVILLYPMLRGADLVPTNHLVSFAEMIDQRRAESLAFRFENEDALLAKANERPLFGWGGWGRPRVFDDRGRDISTTDGQWVIVLGQGGWVRYIGEFGLLTLSMIFMAFRSRSLQVAATTAGLSLVLTANLIDLIPNSAISPITWLMAGALFGRLEVGTEAAQAPSHSGRANALHPGLPPEEANAPARPVSAYTRQTTRHRRDRMTARGDA